SADESDVAAGAMPAWLGLVVGVCANAAVASIAEPARPAAIYFANMWFSPSYNLPSRKPASGTAVPIAGCIFGKADRNDFCGVRERFVGKLPRLPPANGSLALGRDQKPPQ